MKKTRRFPDRYIASFSLNSDNLNMWNYYTKEISKTGYGVMFNQNELKNSIQNLSCIAYKVNYDKEKLIAEINRYINCFNNVWDCSRSKEFLNCLCEFLIEIVDTVSLQHKHQAFSNEEEVRIEITIRNMEREKTECKKLMKFRDTNGIIVPFLNIEFDKKCVEGVIISPTQQDELAIEGLSMILENNGYEHVSNEKITISDIPLRY